jgi:hypothetical protein
MPQTKIQPGCDEGRHRPVNQRICNTPEVRRAKCAGCGYELLRTAASRRWYISDWLG